MKKHRIVCIGGGTGLPILLRGIKKLDVDITAIVTVSDDGGSSGKIRDALVIPPPGDVRNVLVALSDVEPLLEELFQHRFENSNELTGHSLGNLLIAGMTSITGNFSTAVQEMSKVLNVNGRVIPSTNQLVTLHAIMKDQTTISGESKIPKAGKQIDRVYLTPGDSEPINETISVIQKADMIIFGPGSLYTSVIPNLLIPGVSKAVNESKALKVYVCNLMTQAGETLNYTASDHVEAIHKHSEGPFIQKILVNDQQIPLDIELNYKREKANPVLIDTDRLKSMNIDVIREDIVQLDGKVLRHDTSKVAKVIWNLLQAAR